MENVIWNDKHKGLYSPKELSFEDKEGNPIQSNYRDTIIENKEENFVRKTENEEVYQVEEYITKDRIYCFNISDIRFVAGRNKFFDGERKNQNLFYSASRYWGRENLFRIDLRNIWRPYLVGLGKKDENGKPIKVDISQDIGTLAFNEGYFAIICNKKYFYPPYWGGSEQVEGLEEEEGLFQAEGTRVNLLLSNLSEDDLEIFSKISFTDLTHTLYGKTPEEQRTYLNDNYNISYLDNYRAIYFGKVSLDGRGGFSDLKNFDMPFFAEKEMEGMIINMSILKKVYGGSYEIGRIEIPTALNVKNQLIEIMTPYSSAAFDSDFFYVYKTVNEGWTSHFQVWCPDQQYLTYTCNQINIKANMEEKVFDQFRYLKYSFNIKDKKLEDKFYLTYMFEYNKGEISTKRTYQIEITVKHSPEDPDGTNII